jgi:NAD(P)H dehydrogenase (quinone)
VNVAVIYYSMTGNTAALAAAIAEGAERAGATVRLRQVAELVPPEVIARNPRALAAKEKAAAIPLATNDDLVGPPAGRSARRPGLET